MQKRRRMNKLTRTGIFLLAFSTIAPAVHADTTRYISDELSTWVRSGPGDQYRLVGKVNAGDQVTVLQLIPTANNAQIT